MSEGVEGQVRAYAIFRISEDNAETFVALVLTIQPITGQAEHMRTTTNDTRGVEPKKEDKNCS